MNAKTFGAVRPLDHEGSSDWAVPMYEFNSPSKTWPKKHRGYVDVDGLMKNMGKLRDLQKQWHFVDNLLNF